ncbi:hypothetical protein D3C87_1128630 [compost metagenome]
MLLEPGPFITDFANENASMKLPDLQVEAYVEAREKLTEIFRTMNGEQSRNPAKLAKDLLGQLNPEMHLCVF